MLRAPDKMRMEGQMAGQAEPLAIVLSRWIRLRPQDIERASGITRAHLWLMTSGKVTRPTPETLRRLALALATDPATGEVDRLKRDRALAELSRAAGYADLAEDVDAGDVVRAVRSLVGNQQATEFWIEFMRRHGAVSPTLQQMLMAMADMYDRPGGEDVTGLLVLRAAAEGLSLAELLHRLMGDGEPARA
jgi:transcriptional regulator with XRE-family HTH domain